MPSLVDQSHVLGQVRFIEQGSLGKVAMRGHCGSTTHVVTIKKVRQLSIASFEHGQHLGTIPVVHVNGADKGSLDTVGPVTTAALHTNETTVRHTGPFRIRSPTVYTGLVARETSHVRPTNGRETGRLAGTQKTQLGRCLSDDGVLHDDDGEVGYMYVPLYVCMNELIWWWLSTPPTQWKGGNEASKGATTREFVWAAVCVQAVFCNGFVGWIIRMRREMPRPFQPVTTKEWQL